MMNVQSFLFLLDLGFGQHAARLIAKDDLAFNDEIYLEGLRYQYENISRRLLFVLVIIDIFLLIHFNISMKNYISFFGLVLMSLYLYLQIRYSYRIQFLYAKNFHFSSKLIVITVKIVPVLALAAVTQEVEPNLVATSISMVLGVLLSHVLGFYLVKKAVTPVEKRRKIEFSEKVKIFLESVRSGSPKIALFNLTNFLLYRGPLIILGLTLTTADEKQFMVMFSLVFFMFGLSQSIYYLWYPRYLAQKAGKSKLFDFVKQYVLSVLLLGTGSYIVFLFGKFEIFNLDVLKSIGNSQNYLMVLVFFAFEMFWQMYSGFKFALDDFGFATRFLKSFVYGLVMILFVVYNMDIDLVKIVFLAIVVLNSLRFYYEVCGGSQWKARWL